MRVTRLILAGLFVSAAMGAGFALAQEGFPLKGSWLGDWGPNQTTRNQVFIVMDWDGKNITGMINPGTDNIPLKNAMLTPPPPPPPAPAGGGRGGGGNRGGGGGNRGGGGRGGGGGDPAAAGAPQAATPAAPAAAPTPPPPPVPKDWLVHFEADAKDRSGATVHYVIDGKIENVGLANRAVEGTWMVGTTKNDFRIVRQ